jgi:hypothetical protein
VGSWGGLNEGTIARAELAPRSFVEWFGGSLAQPVPAPAPTRRTKKDRRIGGPSGGQRPSEARQDGGDSEYTTETPLWQGFPHLAHSFSTARHGRAAALGRLRDLKPPPPRPPDPNRPHASLEELTGAFRHRLAIRHMQRARLARRSYIEALDLWSDALDGWDDAATFTSLTDAATSSASDAVSTEKWHTARAGGQVYRFDRVRECGKRTLIATCQMCGEDRKPVRETCDVRRVCESCDVDNAKARRARFGRARARRLLDAIKYGDMRWNRPGGAFGERMLTLTVPHIEHADARGELARSSTCTVDARIVALFSAWPVFVRKLNRWWKTHHQYEVAYHRAFEWTLGNDSKGHPHFHVYLFSPFVDVNLIREWWAEALRHVGCPVAKGEYSQRSVVMVDLRLLRSPTEATIRELLKGGKRSAIELSAIVDERGRPLRNLPGFFEGGGVDAFSYADGWTLGEVDAPADVRAQLYISLEGRRLTQASRDFFVDDDPPKCECCGGRTFRVRFEVPHQCEGATPIVNARGSPRGPPS